MRKLFVALLVGAVAVSLAAPAFAADLKFTGAYRVRFQFDKGLDCLSADPDGGGPAVEADCDGHTFEARFRPRFDVETEGGVKGVVRLEIGDLRFGETNAVGKGATGGLDTDGVNIETKWAYIDFPVPATPFRLTTGLFGVFTSKALVIDADFPGISLYGKLGNVNLTGTWVRANNAVATDELCVTGACLPVFRDSDVGGDPFEVPASVTGVGADGEGARDLYILDAAFSPMKDLTLNAYFIYDHDMESTLPTTGEPSTGYWIGAAAAGKVQNIRWDLDFAYGSKELDSDVDRKGWVVDGGVGMAFPGTPLDLELRGWYASGEEDGTGDIDAFPSIAPGHEPGTQVWGGGGAIDVNAFADNPQNTWAIGLIARYTVSPTLKLAANLHYIGTVEEGSVPLGVESCAGDSDLCGVDTVGTEVGLVIDYTIARGLVFTLTAGHLLLGDDESLGGTRFDDVTKIAGVLNYGF